MQIIDIEPLRSLRTLSQTRPLWKRPSGVHLIADAEKHKQFCQDVLAFQVGRLSRHPGIHFGNVTVLQLHLFPGRKGLVRQFKHALEYLRIRDLCIHCGEVPSFMDTALKLWASSLQDLIILKIVFDRFSFKASVFLHN